MKSETEKQLDIIASMCKFYKKVDAGTVGRIFKGLKYKINENVQIKKDIDTDTLEEACSRAMFDSKFNPDLSALVDHYQEVVREFKLSEPHQKILRRLNKILYKRYHHKPKCGQGHIPQQYIDEILIEMGLPAGTVDEDETM